MTGQKITPFLFEGELIVRVIDKDGALWFVATDVCRALGLTNAGETVRGLDDDEKGIGTTDILGDAQETIIISESGLYALIFKSRKPHAIRFRKWVTAEVLPSLRKNGSYSLIAAASGLNEISWPRKPYPDWSVEEMRVALAQVNTARMTLSQGAGAWMWQHIGLPVPPPQFLPPWWQGELALKA